MENYFAIFWKRAFWYLSDFREMAFDSWDAVFDEMQKSPRHSNIKINKASIGNRPPFPKSRLVTPKGCVYQFRSNHPKNNLHVMEYKDHYLVHIDRYNPRKHIFRHWIFDAPVELAINLMLVSLLVYAGLKIF